MRFTNVVLAYFVMGAVMWGGGAIAWQDSGLGPVFIETPGDGTTQANEETSDDLSQLGGPIQAAASAVAGTGLIAVWNILVKIVGVLNWPIITLISQNAPPRVTVVGGGAITVAFWVTFIRLVRSSA